VFEDEPVNERSRIGLWKTVSGTRQGDLASKARPFDSSITTISVCDKAHALAVGLRNGSIEIWDAKGHHIVDLIGHKGPVECLALSPDGFTLASGGSEGTIVLWDLKAACGRKE